MLRIAVVGVNHIGRIHCRCYKEHADSELIAICDLNKELADSVAAQFGVKAYYDLDTMLEAEQLDIISVATGGIDNGSHHREPVMKAIAAGKDVLVEKPISNSLEEAREMVQFAKEKGVRFACNLNHRFTPAAKKAKQWMMNGDIGHPLFVNMKLTIGNPNESSPWIHLRALHPHSLDVMRYFAGEVRRVQAFLTKAPGRTVWSTASINLEFASGAVGHLLGSYDMFGIHPIEACEVAGDQGRFVLDNVYESLTYYPHRQEDLRVYRNSIMSGMRGFEDTFRLRLDAFIQEVKEGVPPEQITASGADALAVQEIIEAAIRSHLANGAVIPIS
ncbi:Gfo/Idh/MocA family oxidoreductase [Paenibacillus sp. CGMCC 1.16610]|uniref:Gfo/Idh/MocA family oxidoreductase n=1 Tax=Paenibacillus anseongense TaxID=2682845 RepID=A0ABW9UBA7_9BACL|nr:MULTISPECIES: Gfo/Idh/MocA family oxidoreductase [Paenibacillus]MBA2938364.1 Gfo/Idh/MocA family oxidoreductase [Paenibacillus sp. CGMCC 1.16610]MVQ37422.1 gfo/Idh/MocA family oxidoreductase [Paenibacillus anseongense]